MKRKKEVKTGTRPMKDTVFCAYRLGRMERKLLERMSHAEGGMMMGYSFTVNRLIRDEAIRTGLIKEEG